jgi:hypothetical protein
MSSSTHPVMSSANNNAMNNAMLTVEQVCFCKNADAPKDYAECYKTNGNVPCSNHTLVPHSNNLAYQKVFHIAFVAQHHCQSPKSIMPYLCMECTTTVTVPDVAWDVRKLSLINNPNQIFNK